MSLTIGDKAPNFDAIIESGEKINLDQYKGKKVVLYFYPKDNTPGCTAQACDLRDNYQRFMDAGYVILGVSCDSETKHQNFINKFDLPFPLIADTEQELVTLYGVWKEKKNFGKVYMGIVRTTFVIDEQGVIADIISKVDTKNHTDQILK